MAGRDGLEPGRRSELVGRGLRGPLGLHRPLRARRRRGRAARRGGALAAGDRAADAEGDGQPRAALHAARRSGPAAGAQGAVAQPDQLLHQGRPGLRAEQHPRLPAFHRLRADGGHAVPDPLQPLSGRRPARAGLFPLLGAWDQLFRILLQQLRFRGHPDGLDRASLDHGLRGARHRDLRHRLRLALPARARLEPRPALADDRVPRPAGRAGRRHALRRLPGDGGDLDAHLRAGALPGPCGRDRGDRPGAAPGALYPAWLDADGGDDAVGDGRHAGLSRPAALGRGDQRVGAAGNARPVAGAGRPGAPAAQRARMGDPGGPREVELPRHAQPRGPHPAQRDHGHGRASGPQPPGPDAEAARQQPPARRQRADVAAQRRPPAGEVRGRKDRAAPVAGGAGRGHPQHVRPDVRAGGREGAGARPADRGRGAGLRDGDHARIRLW